MKYNKLFIVTLICLVSLFIYFLLGNQKRIEKDYFLKAGITSFFYKDILSSKGRPLLEKEIIDSENGKEYAKDLLYPGYRLFFMNKNSTNNQKDYFLANVKITDKNYRIGSEKIGIGTSKSLVEKVYKDKKRILDINDGFIDGDTWIQYKFDKNQNVSEIKIYYGP
ncbi:hypothetical protein ACFSGI_03115 [Paenibacillus nicotianae]|uniref:Lipoprotein n=1 Tax=Paenibacillus nicotianae TaxID=1526551 RepID=A0ABW4USE8_9BACL